MAEPWQGESSKTESQGIVWRIKNQLNHPASNFTAAMLLNDGIDKHLKNPALTDEDRQHLAETRSNYQTIMMKKNSIIEDLDSINGVLEQIRIAPDEIPQQTGKIRDAIEQIDLVLKKYNDKLIIFQEDAENQTEAEKAWETKACEQVKKLEDKKTELESVLSEIESLKQGLKETETTVTEQLEQLLKWHAHSGEFKTMSPAEINSQMKRLKDEVCVTSETIERIYTTASAACAIFFDAIKNIGSRIASILPSVQKMLKESEDHLNEFPARQQGHSTSP
jgi:DNA repair exonuclease SbcCD ATPase subunit